MRSPSFAPCLKMLAKSNKCTVFRWDDSVDSVSVGRQRQLLCVSLWGLAICKAGHFCYLFIQDVRQLRRSLRDLFSDHSNATIDACSQNSCFCLCSLFGNEAEQKIMHRTHNIIPERVKKVTPNPIFVLSGRGLFFLIRL